MILYVLSLANNSILTQFWQIFIIKHVNWVLIYFWPDSVYMLVATDKQGFPSVCIMNEASDGCSCCGTKPSQQCNSLWMNTTASLRENKSSYSLISWTKQHTWLQSFVLVYLTTHRKTGRCGRGALSRLLKTCQWLLSSRRIVSSNRSRSI